MTLTFLPTGFDRTRALMLTILHGSLQILDEEKRVVATVGIDEMYELARANHAVEHLCRKYYR